MGKVICEKAASCTLLTNCAHGVPHVPRGNCTILCGRCVPVKEEPKTMRCPDSAACLADCTHREQHAETQDCSLRCISGCVCGPVPEEPKPKPKTMRCPTAGTKEDCESCQHCEDHSKVRACKTGGDYCPTCEPVPEESELKFGDTVWYNILDEEAHEGRYLGVVRSDPSRIWIFSKFYGRPIHRRKINTSTTPKKKELWEDLEVGQPVVVWGTDPESCLLKFFHRYSPGKHQPVEVRGGLASLHGSSRFLHFRLPTKAEMIKLGFDLNRWKFTEEAEQSLQDGARQFFRTFSQPSTRYQGNKTSPIAFFDLSQL